MKDKKYMTTVKQDDTPETFISEQEELLKEHIIPKSQTDNHLKSWESKPKELTDEEKRQIKERHESLIKANDAKFADIRHEDMMSSFVSNQDNKEYTDRVIQDRKQTIEEKQHKRHGKSLIYRDYNGNIVIQKY